MFMMLEVIKIFSFMNDQMVAMMQLLLLYQCLFRSARRITLKMLWKTMWSTHMLGEEQPVCLVKTIEHPKTQKADQSRSVELSSTPLLPYVASSQEHDLDTRLHTSWRFTPFLGQGILIKKAPQHFQTSINRCKFTRASEVCFCKFI